MNTFCCNSIPPNFVSAKSVLLYNSFADNIRRFLSSKKVVKKGRRSGRQRYICRDCGKQFQSKQRKVKLQQKLWQEYVHGKQTTTQLGDKYHRCRQWVARQLNEISVDEPIVIDTSPQSIVAVADATFFTRGYGILCFRDPHTKKNLIWKEIYSETPGQYEQLKLQLEEQGIRFKAVVLDGKRGVREIFRGIPVQMCHFHQVAIITRYLTTRPMLEAGKELRQIALRLTKSTETDFISLLEDWQCRWREFLKEKTTNPFTGKWHYTHKRIRSAYRSLKTNLPYLFTFQRYPAVNIPNTCNSIDGSNTTLKNLLRNHRGLNRRNRYKMICQILGNSYPQKLT